MKAIICEKLGLPSELVFKELEDLIPGDEDLIVTTKACAVNFPDTLIIQGKYQYKPDLPFIPGSDFAGVVTTIGRKVSRYKVGDKVFGMLRYGAFAEQIKVKQQLAYPIPAGMDFDVAASFLYAYATSLHALKDRAQIKAGDTIAILGAAGGVGLAAVDLAVQYGAKVIACASTDEKLELCKSYGAQETINYQKEDLKLKLKELTQGKGVDIIYDPVGATYTEAALRAIAWGGKYLVVGFAAGDIPKLPLNLVLLKGCQVIGVFLGRSIKEDPNLNFNNSKQIIEWIKEEKIKPHIHQSYALKDTALALQEIIDRKVKGKIIITI